MIKPEQIPQFTGDLFQLELAHQGLKTDAGNVRTTGSDVHSQFQGLSAYYTAPEAEQLFASTKPVKDRAEDFATDLETVSSALSSYATEIRPLVSKLVELKTKATTFVNSVKDDDDWEYDGDKVEEHNGIRDEITTTVAAFWAAERTCHNKITAIFGGTQMVAGDGSDRKDQYGFNAEDLKNAKLPWGDPVEEKHHWYEVGHWVKSFVWDGLIVDGVWGTIKGLGTLVGFGGWDAMGQAWKGLAQLATGLVISSIPGASTLFWTLPDDKLPSWLRDSRTAMKETGKALVAWDEWGKNPARAAGAVTFNVLTTVFTGGSGAAASGAGKAGAVAKVLSVAGKAGKVIDPMTYVMKGAGAGLSKIGDISKALKGVGNIEIPKLPENAFTLPEGALKLPDGTFHFPEGAAVPEGAVKLPDGNFQLPEHTVALPEGTTKLPTEAGAPAQYLDPHGNVLDGQGNVVHAASDAPTDIVDKPDLGEHGPSTSGADNPHTPTPVREPALVGAGTHTAEQAGHQHIKLGSGLDDNLGDIGRVGDDATHTPVVHAGGDFPGGKVGDNLPGGKADHLPTNELDNPVHTGHNDTPGTHHSDTPGHTDNATTPHHDTPGDTTTPHHGGEPPAGSNVLDDAGNAADDAAAGAPGHGTDIPEKPARPDFMQDGDNPYGREGSLTDEQVQEIQVYRANHDKTYFDEFYKNNGNRKSLDFVDESGKTPPQLTRQSPDHPWTTVDKAPEPLKPRYLGDWVKQGPDTASPEAASHLNDAAETRHYAIHHDKAMENWKHEANKAHDEQPTWETDAERVEAQGAYRESHVHMRDSSEAYGEAVAEHHVIPEHYEGATRETTYGPRNGNDQFDQVWRREDGGYVVVEAKSSVNTELGARNLPNGKRVSQGTREYFFDILDEMRKRGETHPSELVLADKLEQALRSGKLDYIVVKGEKNVGEYAGYQMRKFDITDRSMP